VYPTISAQLICRIARHTTFIALVLLILAPDIFVPCSHAVDSPAKSTVGRTVRVGVYDTKPLAYSDKDGSAHGFFVDMVNRIAEKEQWNVQYVPGTWQEGLDRLKNDQIDMVLCIAYTEAREKYMDFPKEYLLLDWGLIFKAKGSKITSLLDLEGKSISALKGDVYLTGFRELVRQFNVNVKIMEVDQYPEVFKAIESGKVEAGVNGNLYGMLNETGLSLEQTPIIFTPVKLGYAVNKGKNGDLIASLDRNIAEMKTDKTSIYHRELDKLAGKKAATIPKEAYWGVFGIAAALLFAITWNIMLKRQVRAKTEHLEAEIINRKSTENSLKTLSLRQSAILSSVPDIIMEVDTNKVYTWANDAGLEFFGEDVIGREAAYYFEKEQSTYDTVQPLFEGLENAVYVESWQRRKDGEIRLLAWWCKSLVDENGIVTGTLSTARDITDSNAVEEERKRLIQQLQEKTSELERFIYTVSHDLKSPLITITGFLGFLSEDFKKQDEDGFNSNVSRITKSAERMKQLLNELLELSRIGRKMNPIEKVNLGTLVQKAMESVSGRIKESGAVVEIDPNLPEVMVDRDRFLQVYENLIDNAVKFSSGQEEPPRIKVGVRRNERGEQIMFVSDNGIGIETHYIDKVFDLFEKIDNSSSGTGVGLAIVKRIIESHGGTIWAESAGIGRGTTFCFNLPPVKS